ncbi:MAG: hypothetical protein DIU60_003805 [Actinomycetes bacterium]|jgi:hypothetical protein
MARFRFHPRTRQALARWLCSDGAERGELELVIEVLHGIMHGDWDNRWQVINEGRDRDSLFRDFTIWPSGSLVLIVREWQAEDRPVLEITGIYDPAEIPELRQSDDR